MSDLNTPESKADGPAPLITAGGRVQLARPKEPYIPPREWIRDNLFSSPFNSVLTVLFTILIVVMTRGLLGFIFSPDRRWEAPATNLRFLMTKAYPDEQFARVWFSFGWILALAGLSLAAWHAAPRVGYRKLASKFASVGAGVILVGVLAPFSTNATLGYLAVGAIPLAGGLIALKLLDNHDTRDMSALVVQVLVVGAGLLSLWTVPYGRHTFVEGEAIARSGTVSITTKLPLTVMLLVIIAAFYAGTVIRDHFKPLKATLGGLWLLTPFILTMIVLRDPAFDSGHLASTDIPIALAFGLGGSAILWLLTHAKAGEAARIASIVILVAALATFLTPMRMIVRIDALMLAGVALGSATFAGSRDARIRYIASWMGAIAIVNWLVTATNTPSTVFGMPTGTFFGGGLTLTLMISAFTLIFSFPLGIVMALARTSKMPIFRVMSTAYIETIRGIPLITVFIFFAIMLPLLLPGSMSVAAIPAIVIGYVLFSAAYLAENVRGGLQSIGRGQHEAAEALGLTTGQKTMMITLPQALRVAIPPLVGQAIGIFKESSLVLIVGLFDLLFIARNVIPNTSDFLGTGRENLMVASLIYWIGAYSLSKASQRVERKLGLGER